MNKRRGGGSSLWRALLALALVWIVVSWFRSASKTRVRPQGTQPQASAPAAGGAQAAWPPAPVEGEKVETEASRLTTRNYLVILDGSGSMAEQGCSGGLAKIEAAKQALAHFSGVVPKNAQLGLLAFDGEGVSERVPLGLDNREKFMEEVRRVSPGGQTPLRTAIGKGLERLEAAARRQLGYGEYNLVVVTDGEAVPDSEDPTSVVNGILSRTPIAIHTIGFCIGENHSLNQRGRTIYKTAQNPAELKAGLEDVLAESETFDAKGFK